MEQNDNSNAYAPPKARVADPKSESILKERPSQIVTAVTLLWISFVVPLIVGHLHQVKASYPRHLALIGIVFSIVFYGFITRGILKGRNWARILFLVLTVFGWISIAVVASITNSFEKLYHRSWLLVANSAVAQLLIIASLALIFFKPGSDWFRKRND